MIEIEELGSTFVIGMVTTLKDMQSTMAKKLSLMQFVKLAEQKTSTHDELMKSALN